MKPILAISLHDPDKRVYGKFISAIEDINSLFELSIIGITPETETCQPDIVQELQQINFLKIVHNQPNSQAGEHHLNVYKKACEYAKPNK